MRDFWSGKGKNPYTAKRQPFDHSFQFLINLAVGGGYFPAPKFGDLTLEEAEKWEKPTLEVDYIHVYQNTKKNVKPELEKSQVKPLLINNYLMLTCVSLMKVSREFNFI